MVDRTSSSKDPAKTTPNKWNQVDDARKNSGAGTYPNFWVRKTRSGHSIIMDDSKGAEHITIQHRGGSMIQMMPDGAVQYVSHNGQQNIVFGENRIWVSGAHDITVEGDASIKCKGNYNATVEGDMNFTSKGAFNVTAKSMNQTISDQIDIAAGSKTEKIRNSSVTQVHGQLTMISKYGFTAASTGDSVAIGGAKDVAIKSGGQTVLQSGGQTSVQAGGDLATDATGMTYFQSGKSKSVSEVLNMQQVPQAAKQEDAILA